jgi:hypothetical protein
VIFAACGEKMMEERTQTRIGRRPLTSAVCPQIHEFEQKILRNVKLE